MLLSNTDLLSWCEHVCIPVKGSSQCASTFPPASFNLDDWQALGVITKVLGWLAAMSLSTEARRNWGLSINRSCPREKEIYFSVLLGMQETLPSTLEMAYRLWKTTGMVVVLGFSRILKLYALWAALRYFPVMWPGDVSLHQGAFRKRGKWS